MLGLRLVERGKAGIWIEAVYAAIAMVGLAVARFIPEQMLEARTCPFLLLTGHPCPSCGMTRAWHAMAHFHFADALRMNPLGVVLFLGACCWLVYAAVVLVGRTRAVRFDRPSGRRLNAIRIVLAAVIIGNWVYIIPRHHFQGAGIRTFVSSRTALGAGATEDSTQADKPGEPAADSAR